MPTNNDEKQLKRCLREAVQLLQKTIEQLQETTFSKADLTAMNSINNFTLNVEDDQLIDQLQVELEQILNQHLPYLTNQDFRNYVYSFLSEYDYDGEQRKFQNGLNVGILHQLFYGLQGLSQSIEAFQAAWDGKLSTVEKFIENYPSLKDKPGPWGTTLLYSSSRNNHFKLVKYLIETAKCSVNAPNDQDLGKSLSSAEHDYELRSKAASTALHAACFNGHLSIVEYLVEHGGDYYMKNQASETPIMNIKDHQDIREYFRKYLLLGYSNIRRNPPEIPIIEEIRPTLDCLWEYKGLNDHDWQMCSKEESTELQRSLIDRPFQIEIRVTQSEQTHTLSIVQFLRTNQNPDENNYLYWLRCRGSSILNFDCYSIWQIMFTHHPTADEKAIPSLEIHEFPTVEDATVRIETHSWYNCDPKMSERFDWAMNYRQKLVQYEFDSIGKTSLLFNLQAFDFQTKDRSICGFIRWIPKLISHTEQDPMKIIDNFGPMTNLNPIPLMTEENEKQFDETTIDLLPDTTTTTTKSSDSGVYTIDDLESEDHTREVDQEEDTDVQVEHFPEEDKSKISISKATVENEEILREILRKHTETMDELRELRDREKNRLRQEQNINELKEDLNTTIGKIDAMNDKIRQMKHDKEEIRRLIKTVQYINIPKTLIDDFLLPKQTLILRQLPNPSGSFDEYLLETIPKMEFDDQGQIIQLTAFDEQHHTFKTILKRLSMLIKAKQSANEFYQRHLNRIVRTINQKLFRVKPNTVYWKQFSQIFYQILKKQTTRLCEEFHQAIELESKKISKTIITDQSTSPWSMIRIFTDGIKDQNLLINEFERLKYEAFEQFLTRNISVQQLKFNRKPTKRSVDTIQNYLNQMRRTFHDDRQYQGYEQEHFNRIPLFLERVMIYYCCFTVQLPLYESSKKLLKDIEENHVITISTSTGSGKSTLLPALLIAAGYDKVLVTQPRRLPCKLIAKRVNETMITDHHRFGMKLAGWVVSGDGENTNGKLLYLTDGLLKERLLNDRNFITKQTKFRKSIVLFIDEVHERSTNIDLCLALIARMLTKHKWLTSKVKVIISSATLDPSVVELFSRISNVKVKAFDLTSKETLFPIQNFKRTNENILSVVKEILAKRERKDQILCFVSSTTDVYQNCKLLNEISQNTIIAYPLTQSQSPREQEEILERGSVFFSTNIAETSLTFPSLKFVVDSGMINVPIFDISSRQITLREHPAADSNIRQRRGRLGRTQPGEYYYLYDEHIKRRNYPIPQICQSDLVSLEFSLRKSPLQIGLEQMKEFLPDKPSHEAIFYTNAELERMNIVQNGRLTDYGLALSKLPDFGSLPMSECVLAALVKYHCGRDLICLASILSVINTTYILSRIPQRFKKHSEGDYMTLLNVMNEILSITQSVFAHKFDWYRVCQAKGLLPIQHLLRQAFKRYLTLKRSFELSPDYRFQAQIQSGNWQFIAKSLLVGYSQNIFVSKKDLQKRSHHFIRYTERLHDTAILDRKSTLFRPIKQVPVSIVLARDILYLPTTVRLTAIISFLGQINADWMEYYIQREIILNDVEKNCLLNSNRYFIAKQRFSSENVNIELKNLLDLSGPAGGVLKVEKYLLQGLIMAYHHQLRNRTNSQAENITRNLESLMKMPHTFRPMVWRWQSQKQVEITVNSNTATKTCDITIRGRDSIVQTVIGEFNSFESWLRNCAVIRHPNAGVTPRLLCQSMRLKYPNIEPRIARITDPNRSKIELYNNVKGNQATRETRMEVVAWICVCIFDCKLEGGFVRDWVVGEYKSKPMNIPPHQWIQTNTNAAGKQIPSIREDVVPRDLDCYLPTHAEFDSDRFQNELYKFGITCEIKREHWRYVVLVDADSPYGAFTMDLIEPHIALTHDRIDFDVNNLVLERNYTRDLGMRVDIQRKPYSIELETIVENIKNKCLQVLRPIDHTMEQRINKMVQIRGWRQIGDPLNFIPNPHPKYNAVLVPIPQSTALYQMILQQMQLIAPYIHIISMEEIKNPDLEEIYEGMKNVIARQCPGNNPNERQLFHGTSGAAIDGIIKYGFDDRFYNKDGYWGHGAYFADDPRRSHDFAGPNIEYTRVMFFNKVLLGNQFIDYNGNRELVSAPHGYHSVLGTGLQYTEYIVYRYGQALPYLKMTYTV